MLQAYCFVVQELVTPNTNSLVCILTASSKLLALRGTGRGLLVKEAIPLWCMYPFKSVTTVDIHIVNNYLLRNVDQDGVRRFMCAYVDRDGALKAVPAVGIDIETY